MEMSHTSVLLAEALELLALKPGGTVLDATVGLGGHSGEILKRILPGGRLIGIDADGEALKYAEERLKDLKGAFVFSQGNFRQLEEVLLSNGVKTLDAAFFDVGVSSYQLDAAERGFSMKHNARLDMRMDPRGGITAYDIVNTYPEKELSLLIGEYGEERLHGRIARYIVRARSERPIETTYELADIVHRAVGGIYKKSRIDPATRTFQAIRIAVNDEINALRDGVKKVVSWLGVGARVGVISFHSLEDRVVKNLFREYEGLGFLKVITRKPVQPSPAEMRENVRSRSAKLRVAERV